MSRSWAFEEDSKTCGNMNMIEDYSQSDNSQLQPTFNRQQLFSHDSSGNTYYPLNQQNLYSSFNYSIEAQIEQIMSPNQQLTSNLWKQKYQKQQKVNEAELSSQNFSQPKTEKSSRKIGKSYEEGKYKKNICGYITKKIIKQFLSETYYSRIKRQCERQNVNVKACQDYYDNLKEKVTGPSHVEYLICPTDQESVQYVKVFREFFIWFLKERYIRYLLKEGKMKNKQMYINYKNSTLFTLFESKINQNK